MKTYILRALHYFVKITVILLLAFGVLYLLEGLTDGRPLLMGKDQMLYTLMHTPKGWIVIGLIIGLSVLYPFTSFTKIDIAGDFERERGAMDRALNDVGFRSVRQDAAKAQYQAKSFGKRLFNQFDDKITVQGDGRYIRISGMKKDVVRVEAHFMQYRKESE